MRPATTAPLLKKNVSLKVAPIRFSKLENLSSNEKKIGKKDISAVVLVDMPTVGDVIRDEGVVGAAAHHSIDTLEAARACGGSVRKVDGHWRRVSRVI